MHSNPRLQPSPTLSMEAFTECLLRATKKRTIDGLFVPNEFSRFSESFLAARTLCSYYATGGQLYFRKGAWKNYGYDTEREFALALSQGRLICRTPAGIVSLGGAIRRRGRRIVVSVFPSNSMWRLSFFCLDTAEAAEVKALIESIAPGTDVRVARSGIASLLIGSPMGRGNVPLLAALRTAPRDYLLFVACMVTLPILVILQAVITGIGFWGIPVAGILFAVTIILSITHASKHHRRSSPRPPL